MKILLQFRICFFLFVILNAPKIASAASATDEFVVDQYNSGSLPASSADDAYIVAASLGKSCFAYRNAPETHVVFGHGDALTTNIHQVALTSAERFTVAVTGLPGYCLFFYTKLDLGSFKVFAMDENWANTTSGFQFNRAVVTTYTMSAIADPSAPQGTDAFIIGFSFPEGENVKLALIRYNANFPAFTDIDLDNTFDTNSNVVKRLNLHQYRSSNLTFMVQFSESPQVWWGKIQAKTNAFVFAENSLPLPGIVGLTSQVVSGDYGVFCYNTVNQVTCFPWQPSTSELIDMQLLDQNIAPGSNTALSLVNTSTVLFGVGTNSAVFAVQFVGDQIVSRNELPQLSFAKTLAVSNVDLARRFFLLVRNATGGMTIARVRYNFCGDRMKNSREECDGHANCTALCTYDDMSPDSIISPASDPTPSAAPEVSNSPGRAPINDNLSPGDPAESPVDVQISTIVPAILVPVVVVAVGLVVLLVLLRRRKKQQGSLLHGKSRVEIAMESIDDRLKIPYKSLVFKKEIGAGSYGKVFVGEWKGTPVAIKVSSSVSDMDGFFDEARITVGLQQHPNVVQTFGVSLDGQLPCIVLELCEGGSLDNRLFDSDVTMTQQQKVALIKGIARGLYHLHTNNIVHRDLAARNVLLNKSGAPKISDFGMSRVLKSEAEKGKTKTNYGPIRWMAPESLKELQYSTKSDVWSFGIVLYEIVSRNEPHIDIDPLEVAVKIKNESYHPRIPQGVDPVLSEIMLSCWQPDPNNRPSMEQICEKLNTAFPED